MRPTPPIPDRLRGFRHRAYTNIYELCPQETRIFGTESLYGDWDAETLLLAKDFAPACLIHQRLADTCPRPYHHSDWIQTPKAPGASTNRKLFELAEGLPGRKLYASAFGGMLRNDCNVSGSLPAFADRRRDYAAPLIRFTIEHMPNVVAVACLGYESWTCLRAAAGEWPLSRKTWAQCRKQQSGADAILQGRSIRIFALHHPAARGVSMEEHRANWQPLADCLGPGLTGFKGNQNPCAHCNAVARKAA